MWSFDVFSLVGFVVVHFACVSSAWISVSGSDSWDCWQVLSGFARVCDFVLTWCWYRFVNSTGMEPITVLVNGVTAIYLTFCDDVTWLCLADENSGSTGGVLRGLTGSLGMAKRTGLVTGLCATGSTGHRAGRGPAAPSNNAKLEPESQKSSGRLRQHRGVGGLLRHQF